MISSKKIQWFWIALWYLFWPASAGIDLWLGRATKVTSWCTTLIIGLALIILIVVFFLVLPPPGWLLTLAVIFGYFMIGHEFRQEIERTRRS